MCVRERMCVCVCVCVCCLHGAALLDLIWTVTPLICKVIVSNGEISIVASKQVKASEGKSTMPTPPPTYRRHLPAALPCWMRRGSRVGGKEDKKEEKRIKPRGGYWKREDEVLIKALVRFLSGLI